MSPVDKLAEYFLRFPGIGSRQARRFVYYLLSRDSSHRKALAEAIMGLANAISSCDMCGRFAERADMINDRCGICRNPNRSETLLIVEKDADFERIEKSGAFRGKYFVLRGIIPLGSEDYDEHIRYTPLLIYIKNTKGLKEIILGLSVTPDAEHTNDIVHEALLPLVKALDITLSTLGRGLSTGSELEYADTSTIESALKTRG